MKLLLLATLLVINIINIRSDDVDCGGHPLKNNFFGDCEKVSKDGRVLYSKTCINEFNSRNYTLAWAGEEILKCIWIKTNGKVSLVQGGIGQQAAMLFIESIEGIELEWESGIYT